jgi:hypothetical protein
LPGMKNRRQLIILAVILVAIGTFYLATIRSGHRWADDFSQYIHHARNIVEGRDYRDTGYIYDPITAVIGPRFYPPIFPLMLAPVYALFGLNLTAMKVLIILFFLLFLGIFALSFREDLSFPLLVGAVVVVGFNPYFWDFKDEVVSDLPFLFLLYLVFWRIQLAYQPGAEERQHRWGQRIWRERSWPAAILVGVLLYLTIGTRTAGLVLLPALFIFELVRLRRLTPFPIIAALIFGGLWLIQRQLIPGPDGYGDQLVYYPRIILNNLHLYIDSFYAIWANGYQAALQAVLFGFLLLLAVVGAVFRLRKGISIYEIFAGMYLILITMWRANQGMRFLIPLAPLFILYVFLGLAQLGRITVTVRERQFPAVTSLVMAAILLSYIGAYSRTDFGPFKDGVEKKESQDLFSYIRQNTQPDDAFLFERPRALALYTNRPAAGYSILENEQFTLGYARKLGIHYFVVKAGENYLRLLVKRYPEYFARVYSNPDFNVYRYLPG